MHRLGEASLQDLKRLCRYLVKKPDISQVFSRRAKPSKLRVQVNSDHAGDAVTRRSTTGMIALYGEHVLKHASNVQSTIALSTGEPEYYALVKGGSVGLGLQALFEDFQVHFCNSGIRRYCCEGYCELDRIR